MPPFVFYSNFVEMGKVTQDFSANDIKNEPMLFSSSIDYAKENGGPITRAFIESLPKEFTVDPKAILDSRAHMLMKGWFPCIPGWHHDDIPRSRVDGQPNYTNPEYFSDHIACIFGDASQTAFLSGRVDLPDVELGKVVYEQWHPLIEEQLANRYVTVSYAKPQVLYRFNYNTFHRGCAAWKDGWRMFFRVSRNTNREIKNEIRKQTQIYISAENAGW